MKAIVIIGDLLICNALFFIFTHCGIGACGENLVQSHIVLTAVYLCCLLRGGVVLHHRKVYKYQILTTVLRTALLFAVVSTPILVWGGFAVPCWQCYCLFFVCLVLAVALFHLSMRRVLIFYRMSQKRVHNAIFVGASDNIIELYHELVDDPTLGYHVCGYFADADYERYPKQCQRLGTRYDVIKYLETHTYVHECYCSLPSSMKDDILPIIHYCENNLVHFYSVPNIRNYLQNRMHFNIIGNVLYLGLHEEPLASLTNRMIKRTFDIVFSLLFLCTLFLPILLVVSIVTTLTMPGPIFFRQKRNGYNGKEFYCLKFRSMRVNSEADDLQASKGDSRITRWGNILRRTNLDETPQFINVLLGDMSVVGPRPHMVKHTEEYSQIIDKYMIRHWVKPGITGWSQAIGFRGETKEIGRMIGRIRGDIWYIEHWSLGLDLYIVYKTIWTVLRGDKNAY